MKLHFIKSPFLLTLILSITVTSCLKDKAFDNGDIQSLHGSNVKVISIAVFVSSQANFLAAAYDASANDTVINLIPVELGGPTAAPQDIHVTLAQNDQLVNDYDSANGTSYVPAPSSVFTVVNTGSVVVIPKGSRTGYLQIKFIPNDFISAGYALGYTIQSVAEPGYTISGNLNNGIVAIGIKNKYDGQYGLRIETIGWGAFGIADGVTNTWPDNVAVVTSGANSVTFNTSEEGPLQPAFTAAGGVTAFGATQPQLTFDPATNKLTGVVNLTPPDARDRAFAINPDPATNSYFDPSTQTIYAAYLMTQIGRPTQFIYDTLTYVGPR